MKVIKENIINKLEVNKSIFYTDLIKVYSKDEIISELNNIKNKYKDATHYCYAYIIDDIKKSSDDGEPGGTAGVPIMETLNNKDLNYILCVVTRYFGGIKLGAGGLVRKYKKSLTTALDNINYIDLIEGYIVENPQNDSLYINCLNRFDTTITKEMAENIVLKFIPAHLSVDFDFRILTWSYLDSLNMTFSEIDSEDLTWEQIDNYES